jgi:hypothetical protein
LFFPSILFVPLSLSLSLLSHHTPHPTNLPFLYLPPIWSSPSFRPSVFPFVLPSIFQSFLPSLPSFCPSVPSSLPSFCPSLSSLLTPSFLTPFNSVPTLLPYTLPSFLSSLNPFLPSFRPFFLPSLFQTAGRVLSTPSGNQT